MLTRAVLNFLRDLVSPALFETWLAGVIATLVFIGALALGLLVVPRPVARPALRALAGFPLFFLLGGTAGILVYLAGGTVRMGLGALLILSIGIAIAALWRGELRELLRWRDISHLGVLLLLGFSLAFFGWGETRDGTVRAMSGAWGDGPLHTLNAEAFRLQAGPDLSFPAFAGESFHEPFGYDFVAAMLREAGFTIGGAFALPAAGLLACLLGWSGALVVRLSGLKAARSASFAAALLILTFGGFQWMEMAQRTGSWAPARFFGVHESAWAKGEALGLIWDNHLNTFSSQKHLLLASAF
ncbi:MAG: hypothetical protein Q8R32_03265, partial [bacterium]|nr:hypothetical protein [bacterium]